MSTKYSHPRYFSFENCIKNISIHAPRKFYVNKANKHPKVRETTFKLIKINSLNAMQVKLK